MAKIIVEATLTEMMRAYADRLYLIGRVELDPSPTIKRLAFETEMESGATIRFWIKTGEDWGHV